MKLGCLAVISGLLLLAAGALAQDSGLVVALAGRGHKDGNGKEADLGKLLSVATSPDGQDVMVSDTLNHKLVKISLADGSVTTWAGTGKMDVKDGALKDAAFKRPFGVAYTKDGQKVVVSDQHGHTIRVISVADETVATVAGKFQGFRDAAGDKASFKHPEGLSVTPDGKYAVVGDGSNHVVRKVDLNSGDVTTLAGTGKPGSGNGKGAQATFNFPEAVVVAPDGSHVMVADRASHCIRKVSLDDGSVETFVGTCGKKGHKDGYGPDAQFFVPEAVAFTPDGKFLMVADMKNKVIRKVSMQDRGVTTLAGDTTKFVAPNSLAITQDGEWVILADEHKIWKVSMNAVCTTLGSPEEQKAAMEKQRQAEAAAKEQAAAKAAAEAAARKEAEDKAKAEREARAQEEAAKKAEADAKAKAERDAAEAQAAEAKAAADRENAEKAAADAAAAEKEAAEKAAAEKEAADKAAVEKEAAEQPAAEGAAAGGETQNTESQQEEKKEPAEQTAEQTDSPAEAAAEGSEEAKAAPANGEGDDEVFI